MNARKMAVRLVGTLVLAGILFVMLAGILFVGCARLLDVSFDMCGNTVVQTVPSPDGQLKVIIFERDCGATTGFSTQVSILRSSDKLPNEAGNLLIIDHSHSATPGGLGGGPGAAVVWSGRRQLLIKYDPWARVFRS